MIIISHRGNTNGPNVAMENSPLYIDAAINLGVDVEIDVWFKNQEWFLGHDIPEYKINYDWLDNRKKFLWVHCKNIDALINLQSKDLHYFWHDTDKITLTSKNYIWAFPSKEKIKQSIDVLPEKFPDVVSNCIGICSDFVVNLKNKTYINLLG